MFSRFMHHIEESGTVSEMQPPKRVKNDSAPVSEDEEFEEDLARLKLKNFSEFATETQNRWGDIDKIVMGEFDRLLKGLRGAQGSWTSVSAPAQAAAFKKLELRVGKCLAVTCSTT
jgi:hypothetical protein